MLQTCSCRTRNELLALERSGTFHSRYALEVFIASQHQEDEAFHLPGFCLLDRAPVDFSVDWLYSTETVEVDWLPPTGERRAVRIPNWRERLICPRCGLNNRQRALAAAVLEAFRRHGAASGRKPRLYLMEQVTSTYRFFAGAVPGDALVGSEFLGPGIAGGTVRDGIRHENAQALSFDDASMDVALCASVLEHVDAPLEAIRELARVLRPGGELFLEVPFDVHKERNTRRARFVDGEVVHLAAPAYHGDPMSEEGALVFTDFGWELLDEIRDTGLFVCEMEVFWNLEYGHLGGPQFFFHASRTAAR